MREPTNHRWSSGAFNGQPIWITTFMNSKFAIGKKGAVYKNMNIAHLIE